MEFPGCPDVYAFHLYDDWLREFSAADGLGESCDDFICRDWDTLVCVVFSQHGTGLGTSLQVALHQTQLVSSWRFPQNLSLSNKIDKMKALTKILSFHSRFQEFLQFE